MEMRRSSIWFRSVLGDPFWLYYEQRRKEASSFVRQARSIYGDRFSSEDYNFYWKCIAFGVLTSPEAAHCLTGTLTGEKLEKWTIFLQLLDSNFCKLEDFFIKGDLCGIEKDPPQESIIALKSAVLGFSD